MGRGRPIATKCPRCKRGKWGYPCAERGVMTVGHALSVYTGKGQGHGCGAPRFVGHRALQECLDCGHLWASTLDGVTLTERRRLQLAASREPG